MYTNITTTVTTHFISVIGESIWNTCDPKRNMRTRFTGWSNIPLSERGKQQARAAGRILHQFKLHNFDAIFTSVLDRSTVTYDLIAEELFSKKESDSMSNFFKVFKLLTNITEINNMFAPT